MVAPKFDPGARGQLGPAGQAVPEDGRPAEGVVGRIRRPVSGALPGPLEARRRHPRGVLPKPRGARARGGGDGASRRHLDGVAAAVHPPDRRPASAWGWCQPSSLNCGTGQPAWLHHIRQHRTAGLDARVATSDARDLAVPWPGAAHTAGGGSCGSPRPGVAAAVHLLARRPAAPPPSALAARRRLPARRPPAGPPSGPKSTRRPALAARPPLDVSPWGRRRGTARAGAHPGRGVEVRALCLALGDWAARSVPLATRCHSSVTRNID